MKRNASIIVIFFLTLALCVSSATGDDLTLSAGGRVTIELISSEAAFSDTLSLVSPNAAVVTNGCDIEATAFTGLKLLSEKKSQHGCRVELDSDPATAGIQAFASGTVLRFNLCAQEDTDFTDCEDVWSSNTADNSDGKNHVQITTLYGGNYNLLRWEDQDNLGDEDFNDLVAVLRVTQDTDGDGLWDDWEQFGIDTDGVGGVDFTLPDADVNHKDIYIEIDYMDCSIPSGDCPGGDTHSHEPKNAAINEVVQAFANAPVPNPDGIDGIDLHVDTDDPLPHQNTLNLGCFSGSTDYDTIKDDAAYFGPDNPRRFAYHYVIFGHRQAASTSSGCSETPGNDFLVTLGEWNTMCVSRGPNGVLDTAAAGDDFIIGSNIYAGQNFTCNTTAAGDDVQEVANGAAPPNDPDGDGDGDRHVGTVRQQSGTLMHELGHNLNLGHGGGDCTNYKPNYLSIMNYWFQFTGILPGGQLNYSEAALPDLDERSIGGIGQLNEIDGIQDGANDTRYVCSDWTARTEPGNLPIDWNCDNDGGADTAVSENINGDCIDTVKNNCGICDAGENIQLSQLSGYDDWDNLKYDFQNSSSFRDGVHIEVDIPDMDYREFLIHVNKAPVCDADGPYIEECGGAVTMVSLDGTATSDPDSDQLTYSWSTSCPDGGFDDSASATPELSVNSSSQAVGCNVSLTVTDPAGNSDECTSSVTVEDTTPPDLTCPPDITIECDESTDPANTGNATASDTCDPTIAVTYMDSTAPGTCPQESIISRTWTAVDASGNVSSCEQIINIADTTPPEIQCNASGTITPPDAPVSFTATATDNCAGDPSVEITGYDCFMFSDKGKRIDKTESCIVEVNEDAITIVDSGGVDDNISWTVRSSDSCGNVAESICSVTVVNPGQP